MSTRQSIRLIKEWRRLFRLTVRVRPVTASLLTWWFWNEQLMHKFVEFHCREDNTTQLNQPLKWKSVTRFDEWSSLTAWKRCPGSTPLCFARWRTLSIVRVWVCYIARDHEISMETRVNIDEIFSDLVRIGSKLINIPIQACIDDILVPVGLKEAIFGCFGTYYCNCEFYPSCPA